MNKGLEKANKIKAMNQIVPEEIQAELNDKQKAFCREYTFDWNATRAYKKAYNTDNEDLAKSNGYKLLANTCIQKYVQYCRDHVEEMTGLSKARLVNELQKIAYSTIAHLHNTWITLKEFENLTDDQKAAIQSIESQTRKEMKGDVPVTVDYVKIKLYNKQAAIDSLAKMQGYNSPDRIDLTNSDNSLQQISTDELLKRAIAVKAIKDK